MLRFKLWIENQLTRETAKKIVLDAVSGSSLPISQQAEMLNSLIKYQPELAKKMGSYKELQPFTSQIQGYINNHGNRTLQDLIDYIDGLDGLNH